MTITPYLRNFATFCDKYARATLVNEMSSMYCASGSSYSEFSEPIKTCQNLSCKTMPPQLLICSAPSTGPRMVGICDPTLKKCAKVVRKKKSAYQRKARHYWSYTKKYAEHPPDTKPIQVRKNQRPATSRAN